MANVGDSWDQIPMDTRGLCMESDSIYSLCCVPFSWHGALEVHHASIARGINHNCIFEIHLSGNGPLCCFQWELMSSATRNVCPQAFVLDVSTAV